MNVQPKKCKMMIRKEIEYMEQTKVLGMIGIVAVCTLFTRILPFIIFQEKQELPDNVKYLGNILPMAVIHPMICR